MRKYILALSVIVAAFHCKAGSSLQGDGRAEQFCESMCSCEGCTEADRGVCVSDKGDLISEADTANCDDQLDGYFTCLGKDAFCDGGSYDTSTCNTEENVLSLCISGISGASGTGVGGASSSSTAASTGVGAADGGTCATCSSVVSGAAPATLCTASQPILSTLLNCGCGVCASSCPNLCINQPDLNTCFSCLQSVCSVEYSACLNDF
jgi:hypothetical protein